MKKVTTENFIQRAKLKHGDKYDYSLTDYVNQKTKVKIICPEHGVFEQLYGNHLAGNGCPKCANYSRIVMNTNLLIERARKAHGDKYDYSLVKYIGNKNKVKIICPEHGVFKQAPYHHMNGHGCPKCTVGNKGFDTDKFIERARNVHGDKYDYSLVKYKHNLTKVKIICPEHGVFEQTPRIHVNCKANCPKCANITVSKKIKYTQDYYIKLCNEKHNNRYDYSLVKYMGIKNKIKIICPEHGIFVQNAGHHANGSNCPKCAIHDSKAHSYIKEFLSKNNIQFTENNKSYISPLELDFYLPDYNLAIEINGIYWHSELKGRDKNYHLNKTKACLDKGIKLIHINENEFVNSLPIIKSKLNSILDINKRKIHGRKCEVREIDTTLKSKFLNKYHLQGNDKASVKLGLFYKDRLVSVMTFCKRRIAMGKKTTEEGEWELSRYCGNFHFYVIGGASKLLKYFERNYNPKKIVTYADKRWSTGDLYFNLGFTHTHDSAPNYWYFKSEYKLYHRFNYRKSELPKKLDTFDPNKTEWENMVDNGWNRIWDCGNMVFEKTI